MLKTIQNTSNTLAATHISATLLQLSFGWASTTRILKITSPLHTSMLPKERKRKQFVPNAWLNQRLYNVAQDITIPSHWHQLMKSRWLLLPDHSAITGICTTGHTAHAPAATAIVHLLWLEKNVLWSPICYCWQL